MSIETLTYDSRDKYASFLMYDIPLSIINTLRRIMLADINNSAFNVSNISIIKNTGELHEDMLSHRISLIPVHSPNGVTMDLNVINTTAEPLEVTSDDLVISKGMGTVYKDIIITTLKPGQELQFVAKSDRNTSNKGGIPYRPISTAYFSKIKAILIKEDSPGVEEKVQEYLNDIGTEMYDRDDHRWLYPKKEGYRAIGVSDNLRTLSITEIAGHLNIDPSSLIIMPVPKAYGFAIESLLINPKTILKKAVRLYLEMTKRFLKSKHIIDGIVDGPDGSFRVKLKVKGVTATILNPLCKYAMKTKGVLFAQYNKKHPNDVYTELHITIKKQRGVDNYRRVAMAMKQTYRSIKTALTGYTLPQ